MLRLSKSSCKQFAAPRCKFSTNARKVIAITGCDSGLGFTLAQRCLSENAVVLSGCLNADGPGAQLLGKQGAIVCNLDVTNFDHIRKFQSSLEETLARQNGRLHAVVNNAGVMIMGEYEWLTSSMIAQQVNVNLLGALNVTHALLPQLRKDHGRLVNIVSHCAVVGLPFLSVYSATKAALLSWSDTLRIEQSKYGIKIVSFIPGAFYGESGIMARQAEHARIMLENMSDEQLSFHEDYFKKVEKYLAQLSVPDGPRSISDEALNKKLIDAVFAENPRRTYKHEPLRYTLYHTLFKILPAQLRDVVIERFVSFPKYS